MVMGLDILKCKMSPPLFSTVLVPFGSIVVFIYILRAALSRPRGHKNDRKLPPGPQPLPVIGNLHLLSFLPHRTLYHLAKKYGPIMSMRLGNVPTIVVSSPEAAELFLKTHDAIFANRPKMQAAMYMSYGTKGIAFTEYGLYWRNVRKLCTSRLVNASQIESFAAMRKEEVGLLVGSLKKAAAAHEVVDFTVMVGDLIQNMTYRMVLGQSNDNEVDLKPLIKEALQLAGAFNIADYVPYLEALDVQGLTRRMKAVSKALDKVLEKIIDEHEQNAYWTKGQRMGFIDELLPLMNQPVDSQDEHAFVIDRTSVKAIILDMIVGAFGTSAAIIEWTLAELLKHPRMMKCVQKELEHVVGINKMVEENDVSGLTYLQMVIKEILRLHPVAPLLVPHESMEDIEISGYFIPKKSRIIVNVWAIGRDPNAWSDNAEEFLPERFKDTNVDFRGHDFQLIPFGSGRRGCPGVQLGLAAIRLVLAQLLHCFNWELPHGMLPNDLDMSETFGLSMPRASRLLAVPTCRLFD